MKQKYVVIHWTDATMNDHSNASREEAGEFDLIDGVAVGLLIKEDKEKVVISTDWFPKDDQFRQISVYPKSGITKIKRYTLEVKQKALNAKLG